MKTYSIVLHEANSIKYEVKAKSAAEARNAAECDYIGEECETPAKQLETEFLEHEFYECTCEDGTEWSNEDKKEYNIKY